MPHPQLAARSLEDRIDPVRLFRVLEAEHAEVFWLDAGPEADTGWSLIGVGESDAEGPGGVRVDAAPATDAAQPPFTGGWVGWLDYESGAHAAGAPTAASDAGPGWLRVQWAIAFDHATGRCWSLGEEDGDSLRRSSRDESTPPEPSTSDETRRSHGRHTPEEYGALIERCREAIRAGDAYQLCLTTRFTVAGPHDPVGTYLRLRAATPAHHGGFLRIGARTLLSASPEQFLHTAGGRVCTRPIKGTRPRGADAVSDTALAAELRASEKERAENVMIVDLMRNDLSRVCAPGSIHVDELWQIESYPAVHQLVSSVSGQLVEGVTAEQIWSVAFPAGSMTGAPKLSAMTILHRLEGERPRGVYSGCFGYIGVDGRMDLAMVIRSILIQGDEAVVGAGGGITWRSDAEAEVAEVATKARAPLAALGAALPAGWRSR